MSVGINNKTIDIYKYLKFKTGKLNHHFIPNQNLKKKIISKIPKSLVMKNFAQLSNNFEVKQVTLKEIKKNLLLKN